MHTPRPARKIRNSNGLSKVIGLFSSKKMNIMVPWESQLERDICYLFEYDKNIKNYISQPKTFAFTYDGKRFTYTPDFYIRYIDDSFEYVEVKYINSLKNNKILNKLELLLNFFNNKKIKFKIIFEDEIRLQPKLKNIKFLYKYANVDFKELFDFDFDTTLNELAKFIEIKYIYSAMYCRAIDFDINEEINENLKLSRRYMV